MTLRRGAALRLMTLLAPYWSAAREPRPGPVRVVGLLSSSVGLGQGARLCAQSLRRMGYEVVGVDVARWLPWHRHFVPHSGAATAPPHRAAGQTGAVIVHLNPPEFPLALALLGRRGLRHAYLVGYWAWELDTIPPAWRRVAGRVDEIWVPSRFVAQAFACGGVPSAHVVPHPVPAPVALDADRARFALPDDVFLCLCVFDARSSLARKNPGAALRAFAAAFGARRDVLLVVKASGIDSDPGGCMALRAEVERAPNMRWMDDTLPPPRQQALLALADVVISLHRSEGFGLVCAEAMRAGVPVLATAWSGNMDFMTADNSALVDCRLVPVHDPRGIYAAPGARWAEPDTDQAAERLRALAADREAARALGARGRRDAERFFGRQRFERQVGERLARWSPRPGTQVQDG